jgi:chromosome segregation ATPase
MLLSATVEFMEAMVAERGTEMTEWNDGRLDDLSQRVDRIETKMDAGFVRLEKKMDEGFARMDSKFEIINERFDGMYQLLFRTSWVLIVGLLGLLGVLVGIVGTQ